MLASARYDTYENVSKHERMMTMTTYEPVITFDPETYPHLAKYATVMSPPSRPVLGRDDEMRRLVASLTRPELSNPFLLGEAGAGKTALVQGASVMDTKRLYVEVDLAKMASSESGEDGTVQMATRIKSLFEEAMRYRTELLKAQEDIDEYDETPRFEEIVTFVDEFHLLVQLSVAAAQAIKPILAESGRKGVRIIAATTFAEFHEFIEKDQALMQRLQRINVREPEKDVVVSILASIAESHGVLDVIYDETLFDKIYEYSNRYVPADSQPRKSILMLDAMIGWYRAFPGEASMDTLLLAKVIYESSGVHVAFELDAGAIEKSLNQRVFSQQFAARVIENRLQIAVADLHDKTRPIASMLFTGSTGTGKALADTEWIPVHDPSGQTLYKRNGDLVPGDKVFNRDGKPVEILNVFPQGKKRAYRVEFADGRSIVCNDEHLWTWTHRNGNGKGIWKTNTLRTLMEKGLRRTHGSREQMKFDIPNNGPVERPAHEGLLDPYVLGVLLGNGSLTNTQLRISSDDLFVVEEVARLLNVSSYENQSVGNYDWVFSDDDASRHRVGVAKHETPRLQTRQVLAATPELIGTKSKTKFIPDVYKGGSVAQRWALVQGMFDTDGSISSDDRRRVTYASSGQQLVLDLQEVLYSLGVASTIEARDRKGSTEYTLRVKAAPADRVKFFRLPRKHALAYEAMFITRSRFKTFETVGIRNVVDLGESVEMTCIEIDDPEHLYQAGKGHIVTHNTEMVKAMAALVFGDERRMIRLDMSEYALDTSIERFREELTHAVWNNSHAIVLLDEVEKADESITRIMLQVLDDGRLSNAQGREVSFLNTYIVLTTNAAANVFDEISHFVNDSNKESGLEGYEKIIRQSLLADDKFAPEIINRMNAIVPFSPLGDAAYNKIAVRKFHQLEQSVLLTHGVKLRVMADVVEYVTNERMDKDTDSGGARGIVAVIESEITSAVARTINENPTWKNLVVRIKGQMAVQNKNIRTGNATVEVVPEEAPAATRQTRKTEQLNQANGRRPVQTRPVANRQADSEVAASRFSRPPLEVRR